jgi:hypothetical protein
MNHERKILSEKEEDKLEKLFNVNTRACGIACHDNKFIRFMSHPHSPTLKYRL